MVTAKDDKARIAKLEDDLKQRDRRIAELKHDLDETRDLVDRQNEHLEDVANAIESWRDTFDMRLDDNGKWTWDDWVTEHSEILARYVDLRREWNRFVPDYNAVVHKRPVGRPIAASDTQIATVRRLHGKGLSLRKIMEETSLGFSTVRTIVGQADGTDRTSQKHRARLERIAVDKQEMARWQRQKRIRDALPGQAQGLAEQTRELIKEAKGLGRAR